MENQPPRISAVNIGVTVLDQIKNYYEEVVVDRMQELSGDLTEEQLLDATCLALNKLPCRYYRCSISMSHHSSIESNSTDTEIAQIYKDIEEAIHEAIETVTKNPRNRYEAVQRTKKVRLNIY